MKVFTASQTREIDKATIAMEPISPINLMERASEAVFKWLHEFASFDDTIVVFCGQGNNGGDGLAVGRMLKSSAYQCDVYVVQNEVRWSNDALINYKRFTESFPEKIHIISSENELPALNNAIIVVDAIFGSGLSRPVQGLEAVVIDHINHSEATVISIDIPSGLFAEDNSGNTGAIVEADYTLSFEFPFLSFFFSENEKFIGDWFILSIGLHKETMKNITSPYFYIDDDFIEAIYRERNKFDFKNNFGHALLVAGSLNKPGAAILSAKACLRTGCGLLTVHIPKGIQNSFVPAVPECMLSIDIDENEFTNIIDSHGFDALGIGPGLGTDLAVKFAFKKLISSVKCPLVLDADALNIIAADKELLAILPENTILTPHKGEFKRMFGDFGDTYKMIRAQMDLSQHYRLIIVCKGAHTVITTPTGNCYFNSTGNQGMATAGSGDVLTGIILSLLAQGYESELAAVFGVWLHGRAGDIALQNQSFESLIAGDIINSIGSAFKTINK